MDTLGNTRQIIISSLIGTLLSLWLLVSPRAAVAQKLEEELPYIRDPVNQWIAVVQDDTIRMLPADLEKTPKTLKISTFLRGVTQDTLVAGVALLTDGEVIATPFHAAWKNEFEGSSISVAKSQAEDLAKRINQANIKVKTIEGEIAVVTRKLRKASGLIEVDELYDKAGIFEDRTREINLASGRLDKMISELKTTTVKPES